MAAGGTTKSSELRVAVRQDTACIKVAGRGTVHNSAALKDFGLSAMAVGARRFVFDMTHCTGMDSTFMGVLAGLALRLKRRDGGPFVLANLNTKTLGLLRTLGIDRLVETHLQGATPREFMELMEEQDDSLARLEPSSTNEREAAEMVYDAHSRLADLQSENAARFRDVLAYLKEDVEQKRRAEQHNGDSPQAAS